MSSYEINHDYDRENRREVKLTGFSTNDDSLRNGNSKYNDLPRDIEDRLGNTEENERQTKTTNGNAQFDVDRVETKYTAVRWLGRKIKRSCQMKLLYKRIPILDWLPKYRRDYIANDLVAGLTVGLTVIPQAIAYANVAGLPLQYGLYSSFMACFVYTIFGSCKDVPVGPTAIAAILTRETLAKSELGPEFAVLLTFISGCVSLLMGILQLGFLIDFISGPVSVGFTSAAAIIIATSQMKDILGLEFSASKFLGVWEMIFKHIGETKLWDAVLGVVCMIVLLLLRKVKDIPVISKNTKVPSIMQIVISKILWFLSTARNIIVVIVCGIGCWFLEKNYNITPVKLTGHVKEGLPRIQMPPFESRIGNQTYEFVDMITVMGSGCLVIPMLSLLESIAIGKVFSDGKPLDATQEMVAIGACNIVSSFVSSMPVSGGLSRGAVNHSSGVKTTLGGVYTGILVLVSLQFLTPCLYYIPKAALAAVIIAAVVFMVELQVVKPMWRTKKIDLIPGMATFLCCLFVRLELGIGIGIGINLLFLLYASARPCLRVLKLTSPCGCEYLTITPDRSIAFPSVEYVRAIISKQATKLGTAVPVVIDSSHIQAADFTAANGIKSLIEDFARRGQPLIFHNLKPSVVSIFKGVKPSDLRYSESEADLNEFLKEFSTVSTITVSRH